MPVYSLCATVNLFSFQGGGNYSFAPVHFFVPIAVLMVVVHLFCCWVLSTVFEFASKEQQREGAGKEQQKVRERKRIGRVLCCPWWWSWWFSSIWPLSGSFLSFFHSLLGITVLSGCTQSYCTAAAVHNLVWLPPTAAAATNQRATHVCKGSPIKEREKYYTVPLVYNASIYASRPRRSLQPRKRRRRRGGLLLVLAVILASVSSLLATVRSGSQLLKTSKIYSFHPSSVCLAIKTFDDDGRL